MSKIITLTTGEEVHMREHFTHGAEKAYSAARDEGVVDREDSQGNVTRETPVVNYGNAVEAAILVMIEKVKKGDSESSASVSWLESLDEADYADLASAMVEIRKAGKDKKNSRSARSGSGRS